ncbi:hypothetical protein OJ252_2813 [Cryptosporidium canis]|uniref:Uncharacterized protein n=1 Tax=Cryptosporidium canis TaxID=195482 RepID=A0ABQ8P459_9CRYT|nr:hypothetical protein OJ252_2813 [Cryptosporidium canis]
MMMSQGSSNQSHEMSSFGGGVNMSGSNSGDPSHSQHVHHGNNNFEGATGSYPNMQSQQYQYIKQHPQYQNQQFYSQRNQTQPNPNPSQFQHQMYPSSQATHHYNASTGNIRPSNANGSNGFVSASAGMSGGMQSGPAGNFHGGSLPTRIQPTATRAGPVLTDSGQFHIQAPNNQAPAGMSGYAVHNFQEQKGGNMERYMMDNGYNRDTSGSQYYGNQYHNIQEQGQGQGQDQVMMGGGGGGGGQIRQRGVGMQDQQGSHSAGGGSSGSMGALDYNYMNYTQ